MARGGAHAPLGTSARIRSSHRPRRRRRCRRTDREKSGLLIHGLWIPCWEMASHWPCRRRRHPTACGSRSGQQGGGASPAASAMRRRIEQRECETAGSHPVSCLAQRLRSVPHPSPQASWLWRLRCRQRRLVHAAPGLSERRRRRQVSACAWAWAWAREGGGSRHLKPRSAASIKQGRRLQLGWRHPARRQRRRRSGRRRGHSRGISSGEATRVQAVASRQPENSRCLNHRKYY
eukprot:COSAG01_NODE_1866_length_9033_cov_5.018359_7_plen_234_part_00